ncbi:hypothetical protein [Achromobacter xylosoxidans]|jgi:hypothetical protein|uniref:hypothetical protein n=1 Tax=Alcaligenes xylosoxydans xylosoxydans TaxID=85698 RepID=UPI0006C63A78|nr:hypothetical protein [Achromobacter xylosoxidans]QQE59023.1 hypothetical protein I6H41_08500 [Achromobacter xylosoxidans]QQV12767.1 hypothetical protein I6I48_23620 [Achromobacter xylosoxidans]UXL02856.1 hypothetical protein N4T34_18450 [Achromobacter xylosoxidans]CUJ16889.1 Uncharacterised protein [Achromobacter xylosoxidans]
MNPTLIKWLTSVGFGLVIGRAAYGVINSLLQMVFGVDQPGAPFDPEALDRMLITGSVLCLVVAGVTAAALLRVADNRRRIAWGCLMLGVTLILTLAAALPTMDLGSHPAGSSEARDAKTAFFFWMLIFGLPYLGGGLALTIGGAVMLRKFRNAPRSAA